MFLTGLVCPVPTKGDRMSRTSIALAAGLLALLTLGPGCSGRGERPLNVVGSTSVLPFAEKLAQSYGEIYPDRRTVEVQGGGSTQGVVNALNGLADIGTSSRDLKPDEQDQLKAIIIARDGLAVIVNNENPLTGLTTDQIRDLFSGRITNWKDVGGFNRPVTLISREEGSGTRESFSHLVMNKQRISPHALFQPSNGVVRQLVSNDPRAIGYISLGLVSPDVKALNIDGVEPTADNVVSGTYKLSRPFLFLTRGAPSPDAQQFIDFVLSTEGQTILQKEGLVRPQ